MITFFNKIKLTLGGEFPEFNLTSNEKRFFFYLSIFGLLYAGAFAFNNFIYNDDHARYANWGWMNAGRLFATYFYQLFSYHILNIDPFTKIFAMMMLIGGGLLVYRRLLSDIPPFIASLIIFIAIAHPYFVENMSFQFESLIMPLAVFCAFAGFYFATERNPRWLLAILSIIASAFTYQVGVLVFAGLVAMYFAKISLQKDTNYQNNLIWLAGCVLIVGVSLMLYSISYKFYAMDGWSSNFVVTFFGTWEQNSRVLKLLFENKITIGICVVPFIIASIWHIISSIFTIKNNEENSSGLAKILSLSIVVFFPIVLFFICCFFIFFLSNAGIRMFLSFTVLMLFSYSTIYYMFRRFEIHKLALIFIYPACALMGNAYGYTKFLHTNSQKYEQFAYSVADDLRSVNVGDKKVDIIVKGAYKDYPDLNDLLLLKYYKSMAFGWFHTMIFLEQYLRDRVDFVDVYVTGEGQHTGGEPILGRNGLIYQCFIVETYPPLRSDKLYSLKMAGNTVLIEFR